MIVAGVLSVVFTAGSGYLFLETTCTRIELSDEGIEASSPWRSTRFLRWSEVTEVASLCNITLFVLTGTDGKKIRVPLYLTGLAELAARIRRHLPPATYQGAERGMRFADGKQSFLS